MEPQPPPLSFAALPPEIHIAILVAADSPADLFSLLVTSRTLYMYKRHVLRRRLRVSLGDALSDAVAASCIISPVDGQDDALARKVLLHSLWVSAGEDTEAATSSSQPEPVQPIASILEVLARYRKSLSDPTAQWTWDELTDQQLNHLTRLDWAVQLFVDLFEQTRLEFLRRCEATCTTPFSTAERLSLTQALLRAQLNVSLHEVFMAVGPEVYHQNRLFPLFRDWELQQILLAYIHVITCAIMLRQSDPPDGNPTFPGAEHDYADHLMPNIIVHARSLRRPDLMHNRLLAREHLARLTQDSEVATCESKLFFIMSNYGQLVVDPLVDKLLEATDQPSDTNPPPGWAFMIEGMEEMLGKEFNQGTPGAWVATMPILLRQRWQIPFFTQWRWLGVSLWDSERIEAARADEKNFAWSQPKLLLRCWKPPARSGA
jgi:hypothetical protein